MTSPRTMEWHVTGEGALYFCARPWCDVRAVTSKCSRHSRGTRESATALAVSQEVAKYTSLPHARRVALLVIDLCAVGTHRTGERSLSFGSRPWCDVRVVTSNAKPAFAWHTRTRHCAVCLPVGGELRKLVARVPCRAVYDFAAHYRMARHRRGGSLLLCKTMVQRVRCDLQVPLQVQAAFAWHACKRHCAGCLSGARETRDFAACAPYRAGYERSNYYRRARHQRKACLFRRKAVARRASCDL